MGAAKSRLSAGGLARASLRPGSARARSAWPRRIGLSDRRALHRLDDAGLRELAGALKKRCGVGGAVKDGVIELQGDHRPVVMLVLRERGYDAVAAGG